MKKITIETNKGEVRAFIELVSIYYNKKKELEKEDNRWIMITDHITNVFKRLINRLVKIADEPDARRMKFSVKRGEGVAMLHMLFYIDGLALPFSYYINNVMTIYFGKLDQALK